MRKQANGLQPQPYSLYSVAIHPQLSLEMSKESESARLGVRATSAIYI